ncbi:MAG: type IV pilus twitching motility protein PilT [Dehalococcoidales bacterium]
MQIDELLKLMVDQKASDLHLKVACVPVFRIDGALVRQEQLPKLDFKDIESIFQQVTTSEQMATFIEEHELDFAYGVPGLARFRVNILQQRGTMGFVFRLVPFRISSIDELGLPQILKELVLKPRGLILITGPTGSGKSTTLAAMVDYLNHNAARSVITIEDPIEFLHHDEKCIIVQRDLGDDTKSFATALTHSLRHDPNVIVVGEMRDLDTIGTAIRAAETGHLVLSTLHTPDAAQTVDRIIDVFPHEQQQQIRLQASQAIEAVLSQALLPLAGGKGRVAAFEIMIANAAVRNLIRDERTFELHNVMQLCGAEGMRTLDEALANLVKEHKITLEQALIKSSNQQRVRGFLGLGGVHPSL